MYLKPHIVWTEKNYFGMGKTTSSYFDYECVIARRNVRKVFRKFRKSVSTNDRELYSQSRSEYKNMLKHKKRSSIR